MRHPRCVGSITKNFCVLHVQSNNYILPISTVIIQLHVSVLYVYHLQFEILTYRLVIQDVWGICVVGEGGVKRYLVVSIVGTMTPSC